MQPVYQQPPPPQVIVVQGYHEGIKGEHIKCCLCFPVRCGFMFLAVMNTISLVLVGLMVGFLIVLFGTLSKVCDDTTSYEN